MQVLAWLSLLALLGSLGLFIYWAWRESRIPPGWVRAAFFGGSSVFVALFLFLSFHTLSLIPQQTHSDKITPQVVAGKQAWQKFICINCHTILGNGAYYAPDLTKSWDRFVERADGDPTAAKRVMVAYLKNPPQASADRRGMPKVMMSDAEAENMVEFLRWTAGIDTNGWPPAPSRPLVASTASVKPVSDSPGRKLFVSADCVACHTVGEGPGIGPDLKEAAAKYDRDFLIRWMRQSESVYLQIGRSPVNPGYAEMPNQEITVEEAGLIADYLQGLE